MKPFRNLFRTSTAFLLATTALAHHSASMYDFGTEVTFEGIVTEYRWTNPHVYLYVQRETDTGDQVVWAIEHAPTTFMTRLGWSEDTFVPGDRVTVTINPARDSNRRMAMVLLVQKEGVTLVDRRNPGLDTTAPSDLKASGVAGTWGPLYSGGSFFGPLADPSSFQLTEEGAAALANYEEGTMNPQVACMTRTAPGLMLTPGIYEIEISERVVRLRSGYDAVERTVHMDATTHVGASVTHHGHSIGWWDDGVLIVDTTHFADNAIGNGAGLRSGSRKHLIERFELNPDGQSLTYRFELEDPEYLAAPVTGEVVWLYRPDLEFTFVPCDLDTARQFLAD